MSSESSSKPGATFFWVLGAFMGFAVLFYVVQMIGVRDVESDPRAPVRLAIAEEVRDEQGDLLEKMGLRDESRRQQVFAKTLDSLKEKKAAKSDVVVPGSPTHLKQLAAEAQAAPEAKPADVQDGQAPTPPDQPAQPTPPDQPAQPGQSPSN